MYGSNIVKIVIKRLAGREKLLSLTKDIKYFTKICGLFL